jgi:hypothetical protein
MSKQFLPSSGRAGQGCSRREFVAGVAAAMATLGFGRDAEAIGASSKLVLAQLELPGLSFIDRKSALQRLSWVTQKRTSIAMASRVKKLQLSSDQLFKSPFLYLCGDESFSLPAASEVARLRRYLQFGGTLLVDSAEARPGGPFDLAVRRLAKAVLPQNKLAKIPKTHTLHKSFYLIGSSVGRVSVTPTFEGISRAGRYSFIYCQNDLGGAWARDAFGQWEHDVYPGGGRQREIAFRWGINILMYTLCVDYKADQVHIPFILKRRRWRSR